jgi:2-amino-4-hydroxy-6-hydroxymethyldihydropteridine diphosphokinase
MADKHLLRGNRRQTRAYIGLGSSRGDRVGFVQQSMQLLKDVPRIKVIECSSLYETQSSASESGPWFVNAVAAIETNLEVMDLFDICRDIENRLQSLHHADDTEGDGDKIIDLAILFFGDQVVEKDGFTIPHPSICQKAYALVPLLEIAPNLVHPQFKKTITQLHEELPEPELVFLYGTREH